LNIALGVRPPLRKTYDIWLGFNPEPFAPLLNGDKDFKAKLIAATAEIEESASRAPR
jgi:hypothetical protein